MCSPTDIGLLLPGNVVVHVADEATTRLRAALACPGRLTHPSPDLPADRWPHRTSLGRR